MPAGRGAGRGAGSGAGGGAGAGGGPRAVLGLGAGAGAREAAAAYRGLMRRVHPDVPGGDAARAAEVNAAYEAVLAELAEPSGSGAGAGTAGAEDDEPSWSGASLRGGDPCELWVSPWDGYEQYVTEGQAEELREYARRGWAREEAAMLREFRWRNDRWRP